MKIDGYRIDRDGRIWSEKRQKFLKQKTDRQGYKRVSLGGREYRVARLVAATYLGEIEDTNIINKIYKTLYI